MKKFLSTVFIALTITCQAYIPEVTFAWGLYERDIPLCIKYCTQQIDSNIPDKEKVHFYLVRKNCYSELGDEENKLRDSLTLFYLLSTCGNCKDEFTKWYD